ncbi:hypothetical protein M758_7G005400 [Ceratodon purpureus]|uniref:Uncharacterized protein n=1 Tax=Ceratodon purpureus TaxID=3225 RepID=A0A8T0H194_CERPU|nr:hypothetical protein KC19_7G005700 [Ceratodon purpureus]KAG0609673.1 hypothetical protein M758_7G005400 [Ceratodon purpureus]
MRDFFGGFGLLLEVFVGEVLLRLCPEQEDGQGRFVGVTSVVNAWGRTGWSYTVVTRV